MIPLAVAVAVGVGIGVAVSGDDKNEIQTSKKREVISDSEVPEDVRRQVEASSVDARCADSYYSSAYYYLSGSNGYPKDLNKSFELFERAARTGHLASKSALRKYFNYEI